MRLHERRSPYGQQTRYLIKLNMKVVFWLLVVVQQVHYRLLQVSVLDQRRCQLLGCQRILVGFVSLSSSLEDKKNPYRTLGFLWKFSRWNALLYFKYLQDECNDI